MELGPRQEALADKLFRIPRRAVTAPELPDLLRQEMEAALAPLVVGLAEGQYVKASKWDLGEALTCEGLYATKDPTFAASIHTLRGNIIHLAIEQHAISKTQRAPLDLVETALAHLVNREEASASQKEFLASLSPEAVHELIRDSNNAVSSFMMDWPPIGRQMVPRGEQPLKVYLCDGRVLLTGKADLAFGAPDGCTPGTRLIELKSGNMYHAHLDDLRFYALLETLRRRVPPLRIALYYTDSGECIVEEVTEETLDAASRRVVDGLTAICRTQYLSFEDLTLSPGHACVRCLAASYCPAVNKLASTA